MNQEWTGGGRPSAQEIRAALERVAASDVMRSSPQLTAFLRFVVQAVLEGNSDRIKGYVIAVEVLKRGTTFNPQIDPIVRVEATRLRRTLERYYAGPGAEDPIVIALPRGTCVPTFTRRTARAGDLAGEPAAGASAEALPPGNGMPVLLVEPFEVLGTPGPRSLSASSLHAMLSDAFARFDLVNIVWDAASGSAARAAADARLDYRMAGSAEYDENGAVCLRFRLIDAGDGSVVWTRELEVVVSDEPTAAQERIVRELAATLVQPFGVIFTHGRAKSLGAGAGDPRYRCILETAESFRSFDSAQHGRARTGLERLTVLDPSFASGFSYLAALYVREYPYGLDAHDADLPPLERALRAARRGVELDPESARAYEMLSLTLFTRRDLPAAFAAGDKPVERNKYDMRPVGGYGQRLIAIGEIDKGMDMLMRAGDEAGVRPAVDQFFLFLGSYLRGDKAAAAFHAGHLTRDTFQLGLLARALAAGAAGEREGARAALGRLFALNREWRDHPRGQLEKFFPAAFIVDRLAIDLASAAANGDIAGAG
jgi:tetratricopeptide (TPR) repeat protein/TolB-like protein